ncbi:hypothetical protein Fmac_024948 [Flemingia macrophylla]|uniref:Plastocyanin-like domain-containing protein n=1 Tax=Flemingia macrophylla TaxID=520843 RepID=A0ABD1LQT6_9FABA
MPHHKEARIPRKPSYHNDHLYDEDRKDKEYAKWLAIENDPLYNEDEKDREYAKWYQYEKAYRHSSNFPPSYDNIVRSLPTKSKKEKIVGADSSYSKPVTRDYISITPGKIFDASLHANQEPNDYYMATTAYSSAVLPSKISQPQLGSTTMTNIMQLNLKQHLTTMSHSAGNVETLGYVIWLLSNRHPITIVTVPFGQQHGNLRVCDMAVIRLTSPHDCDSAIQPASWKT